MEGLGDATTINIYTAPKRTSVLAAQGSNKFKLAILNTMGILSEVLEVGHSKRSLISHDGAGSRCSWVFLTATEEGVPHLHWKRSLKGAGCSTGLRVIFVQTLQLT